MPDDRAALASLSTALGDLTDRVAAIAVRHVDGDDEQLATDLFEVERSLRTAARRLERARRELG